MVVIFVGMVLLFCYVIIGSVVDGWVEILFVDEGMFIEVVVVDLVGDILFDEFEIWSSLYYVVDILVDLCFVFL